MEDWKKIFYANRDQKKAGVAILMSDKIDFTIKTVKRDKEGHYIMIKGSTQEKDLTIINIYAPNIGALQYVRQMLTSMKGEINNNAIIVGDFNTPLTPKDRSTKQKINKETQTLNDTIDQLDLIDIYRTFHPTTLNFTFFSSTHGTFSRIDNILGHKSSLQFSLVALSIGVSGVLKSPTIIVLLLISPFILVSICLTDCGAPMLGAYIFIIVISSSWIDPLIII